MLGPMESAVVKSIRSTMRFAIVLDGFRLHLERLNIHLAPANITSIVIRKATTNKQ